MSINPPPETRGWQRQRVPARQDGCWLAGGSDSPEAGGEGEAGTGDPGPRSRPSHLSSRDREEGRRRPLAASLPGGRGHRGRLEEKREGVKIGEFSLKEGIN